MTSEAAINLKGWRRRVKSAQFFPDTIATGEHRYFVSSSAPQYLASGHVVAYVLAGRLFVVPFDDASSELRGAPVLVIERVSPRSQRGVALCSTATIPATSSEPRSKRFVPTDPSERPYCLTRGYSRIGWVRERARGKRSLCGTRLRNEGGVPGPSAILATPRLNEVSFTSLPHGIFRGSSVPVPAAAQTICRIRWGRLKLGRLGR